ncbi:MULTISPECIES: aminotransferase class V-fold PLP-dependent enzyme [unclassified Paenibacillus]|uniref:aminotransferase class V-fold PLP-dependent enzyme n=1 Tax=unclassified Paenibacillus TaxID=185978 RepID=UPI001C1107ED|nr:MULTISPECIES: aminotransferase class V-fold PLP-dependent enzyme [unclassified Paenibacillus]MBU5441954.1 aminotransferase class V-fold PLP-dependent enzyme [Paenibacillus sp. MSJ-34]CAH0121869.1 putative cysteine desulfurase [Paenibacillus sp. CECT 9249]
MGHEVIRYFDHAATSWPKPPQVIEAMQKAMLDYGANPGRGSHAMAVQASRVIYETRRHLSQLFGVRNPMDVIFTLNTTMALNLAIKGIVRPGDHIVVTGIEHNSVRRPVEYLRRIWNLDVTYIKANRQGVVDLRELEQSFRPHTKLVACSHSSNLLGTILPVGEVGEMTRKRGVKLLVDAAQTAGTIPIDVASMGIDMLAFPGHKGLLGPQGTGGLYIAPDMELEPLLHGGTGSQSDAVEQPGVRPDRYEAGTPNTVGLAGLNEGVKFILNETVEKIHTKEWKLTQRMMDQLRQLPGIELLGPDLGEDKTGIVSFTVKGADNAEIAFRLDREYGIAVRAGYHCTPLAHDAAGTTRTGAVRASVGYTTTEEDVNAFLDAMRDIQTHSK